MANYSNLLATIAANIYTNGNNEVTAAMVKAALDAIVAAMAYGYLFKGSASPSTDPGTPDTNVCYFATTPGEYPNFDNLTVDVGKVALFCYDGTWKKVAPGVLSTYAVVDDLVTSSTTRVLSAKQGKVLKDQLDAMAAEGYKLIGAATPSTNPGTPSGNVAYLAATAGTYTNFGGLELADGEVAFLKYSGSTWSLDPIALLPTETADKRFSSAMALSFVGSHYLKKATGEYDSTTSDRYKATQDYYDISGASKIVAYLPNLPVSAPTVAMICFYDKDYNFISAWTGTNTAEYTAPSYVAVPAGAKYVRFGGYSRYADEWSKVYVGLISSALPPVINGEDLANTITYASGVFNHNLEVVANANIDHSGILEAKAGDLMIYTASLGIGSNENLIMINEDESVGITLVRVQAARNWQYVFNRDTKFSINVRKGSFDLHWYRSATLASMIKMPQDLCTVFDARKYVPLLENAKMPTMRGNEAYEDVLSLLHFSDVHATVDNLQRVLQFKAKFPTYIDDVIHTGDICSSKYGIWNPNLELLPGYDKMLQVIGNHDVYDANNDFPTNPTGYDDPAYWATPAQKYARYMKYIGDWGVVQPADAAANGYCYYYKDYASAKMRLIVLDAMAFDATQLAWFESVLADAITAGYAVVVADHFKPTTGPTDVAPFDTPFCSLNDLMSPDTATRYLAGAPAAIDTFIGNGGEFVCWLCGHTHYDQVATVVSHPSQIFICVGKASYITGWQDSARVINQDSEDLFNIIAFDYHQKVIKVFRVGGEVDQYMRHRGGFCLNWQTRTLLNTW